MFPTTSLLSSLPPTIRSLLSTSAGASSPAVVHAWIKTIRHHKNVSFLEVSDGTTSEGLQVVLKGKGLAGMDGLHPGTSTQIHGTLQPSRGSSQSIELSASSLTILGACDPTTYPIQNQSLPPDLLRNIAHLRFRTSQQAAVARFREGMMKEWADYFEDEEFTHIHTPLMTSSDCEGAGESFLVTTSPSPSSPSPSSLSSSEPFFPTPAHLTVSSQLHLEAPLHSLSRTYTLSPAFRAEKSATSRHLAEFWMLEAEVGWLPEREAGLEAVMDTLEDGLKRSLVGFAGDPHTQELRTSERWSRLNKDLEVIMTTKGNDASSTVIPLCVTPEFLQTPFARITYTEAITLLQTRHSTHPFTHAPTWGLGLQTEHEKYLASEIANGPIFVTHYPQALKPFYMRLSPPSSTPPTVECFDLLVPHLGELAGGSVREERVEELERAIEKAGLKKEQYEWYVDLRRYGGIRHGGWGMGWERFLCWVGGVGNVRDVVAFPRWKGSCKY